MKWHAWCKWPLIGVAVTAVVLAAPSDPASSAGADIAGSARGNQQRVAGRQQPGQATGRNLQGDQTLRVELERLKRVTPGDAAEKTDIANAFSPTSWYQPPPPPPPMPAPKPVAPTAPPMPFTYFGRYENPPSTVVMLARNDQVYTVSEGDVIDDTYRVEHVTDGSVSLVYLPLGTVQSISMNQSANTGAQ